MTSEWDEIKDEAIGAMQNYVEADERHVRAVETTGAEVLYHLTDAETAIKIANPPNELWAFEVSTMNDVTEVTYGRNLLATILDEKANPTRYEASLKEYVQDPGAIPELAFRLRHFVVSFCSRLDRASAWLNYGRDGTGVGLGFKRSALRKFTSKALNEENPYLVEVDYSRDRQRARLQGMMDLGAKILQKHDVSDSAPHAAMVAHLTQVWLSALAVRMKDPCFEQEDEWRLIAFELWLGDGPAEGLDTMPKGRRFGSHGQIRPYVTFPLPAEPVQDIVLGFSCQAEEPHFKEALPAALRAIPLSRSPVPVRPT